MQGTAGQQPKYGAQQAKSPQPGGGEIEGETPVRERHVRASESKQLRAASGEWRTPSP
jgi:hypothetical protein